jgi:hypothetical protein
MQSFEITAEEAEVLREELESCLKEIELELSRADSIEFKHMLKHRRETVKHLLAKFAAGPVIA